MSKDFLPPDKLTLTERWLLTAFVTVLMAGVIMGVGLFLHMPLLVGGAAVIVVCAEIRKRRSRPGQTSGHHGTGHFAGEDEIDAAGFTGGSDGLIVGVLPSRSGHRRRPGAFEILRVPRTDVLRLRAMIARFVGMGTSTRAGSPPNFVRVPSSDKYSHVACYMSTGVGKTRRVIIPNLLTDPDNCVVYDTSGDTYRETAEWRRRRFGHTTRLIDPFGICKERFVDRLNVLNQASPDDRGLFDYCSFLANALVVEKPDSRQEPIWHSGNLSATGFLLHAIMLNGGNQYRSLPALNELLSGKRLHELAESFMDHPDSALRRRAQQILNFRGRTLDSLLATMSGSHGWLDSPAFADVLSGSTFCVHELLREPMTLYVVVPGNRALEAQPFIRVILTAILYAAFEAGPDIRRPPLRFILDEAATLGKLDLLMTLYTQGRKFGLRSLSLFQSVAQVAEIVGSPDKIQTFRGQMSGELFKAKDLQSAKEVSEWIGNTTVFTESVSFQEGRNGGWSNSHGAHPSEGRSGGWSDSNNRTISETGVPVIRPEEILQLREREAIFVSAGTPPVRLNILDESDLRRCREQESTADQKGYLRRVRWHAVVMLLCYGLPLYFGGLIVFGTGCMRWSQPVARVSETTGPVATPGAVRQERQRAARPRGGRHP